MPSPKPNDLTGAYTHYIEHKAQKPKRRRRKAARSKERPLRADVFVMLSYLLLFFAGVGQLFMLMALDVF